MQVLDSNVGVLKVLVASQGVAICEGTPVVIETVVDNFKNITVQVRSTQRTVVLPFYGTDVKWLLSGQSRFKTTV
jgi:hypothetical protein